MNLIESIVRSNNSPGRMAAVLETRLRQLKPNRSPHRPAVCLVSDDLLAWRAPAGAAEKQPVPRLAEDSRNLTSLSTRR